MTDDDAVIGFDLREAFLLRQEQLLTTLGLGRGISWHAGTMGDDSELNWIGMLRDLLPSRYRVDRAFVVSSGGGKSEQLDIVIHDRHFSPLLFEVGMASFIPAESVYAVFEVKQSMSKGHLEYASDKIASVRRLERTSAIIPHAGGEYEPRQPPRLLGGFLALRSDWTPPFGSPFEQAMGAQSDEGRIDIGCVLEAGSFERPNPDGREVALRGEDEGLMFFALTLLRRLQSMASVPAIDYSRYGAALDQTPESGS